MSTVARQLDTTELEQRVKRMYEEVALEPEREFHFETGRPLAERLGYPPAELDRIPAAAIDSFAGVGYFLDLAAIAPGETVLDLGSGSGTDSFLAALATGTGGYVIGVDMTAAQLAKARRLAAEHGFSQVEFRKGYIERPPVDDASVDCVISNGVINLSPDKPAVFAAAARALRPGGRLALADIVTDRAAARGRDLRRRAVGRVHRRRDAARRLPRGDRGRRLRDRDLAREQRVPLRLRASRQRDRRSTASRASRCSPVPSRELHSRLPRLQRHDADRAARCSTRCGRTSSSDFGNPSSAHAYGDVAREAVDARAAEVADAARRRTGEHRLHGGGSEADNLAIKGVALARLRPAATTSSPRRSSTPPCSPPVAISSAGSATG